MKIIYSQPSETEFKGVNHVRFLSELSAMKLDSSAFTLILKKLQSIQVY